MLQGAPPTKSRQHDNLEAPARRKTTCDNAVRTLNARMRHFLGFFLIACVAACGGEDRDLPIAEVDCRTGLYQSAEGEALALTPVTSGGYRWRMIDGRTGAVDVTGGPSRLGWTDEPDGFEAQLGACGDNRISLGQGETLRSYTRVPLDITDVTFEHDGLQFSGRLIWPAGLAQAPLAVHVHGSERWSSVRSNAVPYLLAAQGVASFVYDKRGAGQSGGEYTQDFHVLAGDARAALEQARAIAGPRISSIGFVGASQGGWVAPLAAREADVDFVVALYGLAVNALQEDRYEIMQSLERAGWGEAEQAKGSQLSEAAGQIMLSDFRDGYAEFDRLRSLYRDEPWFEDLEGEFTSEMLPYPSFALRLAGPMRDLGTSWEYEPLPVLRALQVPQFWMIAADDTEAPAAETIARIRSLQAEGRPIDLAIYPGADHGMILTERDEEGERRTGHVRDYFRTLADWIKSRDLSAARAAGAEVVTAARPAAPETPAH